MKVSCRYWELEPTSAPSSKPPVIATSIATPKPTDIASSCTLRWYSSQRRSVRTCTHANHTPASSGDNAITRCHPFEPASRSATATIPSSTINAITAGIASRIVARS